MRWIPWPVHRTVWFDELRRLPPSRARLANLEWVPNKHKREIDGAGRLLGGRLIKRVMGYLWVDRLQVKDLSSVPGVWERMWEQIPMKGEERKGTVKKEGPIGMVNRAGPSGGQREDQKMQVSPRRSAVRRRPK